MLGCLGAVYCVQRKTGSATVHCHIASEEVSYFAYYALPTTHTVHLEVVCPVHVPRLITLYFVVNNISPTKPVFHPQAIVACFVDSQLFCFFRCRHMACFFCVGLQTLATRQPNFLDIFLTTGYLHRCKFTTIWLSRFLLAWVFFPFLAAFS
jgi:hypothetical protein